MLIEECTDLVDLIVLRKRHFVTLFKISSMKNPCKIGICSIVLLTVFTSAGQEMRFKLNGGYGFGFGAVTLGEDFQSTNGVGKVERVKGSYGEGIYFGGSVAYFNQERIGIECAISYTASRSFQTNSSSVFFDEISGESYSSFYSLKSRASMFQITPSIVLSSCWKEVDPYVRIGFILGIGHMKFSSEESGNFYNYTREHEFYGGTAFGLNTAFGIHFYSFKNISFFSEINMVNMNYAPSKGRITAYSEGGIDRFSSLTIHDREVEFVDEYSFDNSQAQEENIPNKAIKMVHPFGSLGLNVGVVFRLTQSAKE